MTLNDRFRNAFSIDLRSLALFRVCLALVLLFDLVLRSFDLATFYTDGGVLPRALMLKSTFNWHWSLYAAGGQFWFQLLLFCIAAIAALCLLVGYRTRLMAVLCWILTASLINRNVYLSHGGDDLLVILAFWAMFLPLNARFSVDAALQPIHRTAARGVPLQVTGSDGNRLFSVITFAVLLQVVYLYFFTALLKTGDAWRVDFTGAWYAVSLAHYATPIGRFASEFPNLLKLATLFVLVLEASAPLLLFSLWYQTSCRLIGLVLLYLLHLSFLLMLHIGLFPLIDFTALTLLIPGAVWMWLDDRRKARGSATQWQLCYDEQMPSLRKVCLLLREFCLPPSAEVRAVSGEHLAQHGAKHLWFASDQQQSAADWVGLNRILRKRWLLAITVVPLLWIARVAHWPWGKWMTSADGADSRLFPYASVTVMPRWYTQLAALFFFYVVTYVNLAGVANWGAPPAHVTVTRAIFRLNQRWDMFAPYPAKLSSFPIVTGELRNGQRVDLLNGKMTEPAPTVMQNAYWEYGGYRWRKYLNRIRTSRSNNIRQGYGGWLCRQWNQPGRKHSQQLATAQVEFILRRNDPAVSLDDRKVTRRRSWSHWCFPEFAPKSAKRKN